MESAAASETTGRTTELLILRAPPGSRATGKLTVLSGNVASLRRLFAFLKVGECYRDFASIIAARRSSPLIFRRFRDFKIEGDALLPLRFQFLRFYSPQNASRGEVKDVAHRLTHDSAEARRAWHLRQYE